MKYWKQRFHNFLNALSELKGKADDTVQNNEILLHRFDLTMEISWKLLAYYLEEKGFVFNLTPDDTFRQAHQAGIIDFGHELKSLIETRVNWEKNSGDYKKLNSGIKKEALPVFEKLSGFFSDVDNQDELGLFEAII